jgi:hypothetical protein
MPAPQGSAGGRGRREAKDEGADHTGTAAGARVSNRRLRLLYVADKCSVLERGRRRLSVRATRPAVKRLSTGDRRVRRRRLADSPDTTLR